jgi:hypothetical protein
MVCKPSLTLTHDTIMMPAFTLRRGLNTVTDTAGVGALFYRLYLP